MAPTGGRFIPVAKWVARRVAAAIVVLFFVSILVFAATQALPSDAARSILGGSANQEQLDLLRHELGLDKPLVTQFTDWAGGIVTGDLGESIAQRRPVSEAIGPMIKNTFFLVLFSGIIGIILSLLLGISAAMRRDRAFDNTFVATSLGVVAVPTFVLGVLLLLLFSTSVFHVFPAVALFPEGDSPLEHLDVLVLPTLTLAIAVVPYLGRLVRASMIDALESEYVQMARLKGVPDRRIMLRHALPNAMVPAIQGTALTLAWLTSGIVAIEYLFRYPGLGSGLADAISRRDIPMIQAIVLVLAAAYVLLNLIADLLTVYLTPRLRDTLR